MFLFCSLRGIGNGMDWDLAIKRNSEALKGIVEALFAMLGLGGDTSVGRIPRSVHSAALRVLRPAESAVRRLIIIAARGLVVKLAVSRRMPKGQMIGKGGGGRLPSFQLFDPRKNFKAPRHGKAKRLVPRIHVFGHDDRLVTLWEARPRAAAPVSPPDGLVNAERLSRRLQALKLALEDLPGQARRLARWRVRREKAKSPKFRSPLRPGPPPGYRRKAIHPIDEVLAECHWLAWDAMKADTS
jgi:hypothetical protein